MDADIVVIGAGPIGSFAARMLSGAFEVLVLEKKKRIGYPKQCAEAISESVLDDLGIDIKRRWVNRRVTCAEVYSPKGRKISFDLKKRAKLVLERKIFDRHMADLAVEKGARLELGCEVIDIEDKDGVIIRYKKARKVFEIKSRLAIIASGVDGRLSRKAGLIGIDRPEDVLRCFQYEMDRIRCPDSLSLYFGSHLAPGGYCWIFPKSATRANVGLGVTKGNPKTYLDRFIAGMEGRILETNAGIVFLTPGQRLNKGRIFCIGDAARAINPIHGGGLNTGLYSAQIVATSIIESYDGQRFDRKRLRRCNVEWKRRFARRHKFYHRIKDLIYSLSDDKSEDLFGIIADDDISRIYESGSMARLVLKILAKPKLYPMLFRM